MANKFRFEFDDSFPFYDEQMLNEQMKMLRKDLDRFREDMQDWREELREETKRN
jgi:hypothetical protein